MQLFGVIKRESQFLPAQSRRSGTANRAIGRDSTNSRQQQWDTLWVLSFAGPFTTGLLTMQQYALRQAVRQRPRPASVEDLSKCKKFVRAATGPATPIATPMLLVVSHISQPTPEPEIALSKAVIASARTDGLPLGFCSMLLTRMSHRFSLSLDLGPV